MFPMIDGIKTKPMICRIDARTPMIKNDFCFPKTKGMVERGETMKFSMSHGAIISESSPANFHWLPNTNSKIGAPKK